MWLQNSDKTKLLNFIMALSLVGFVSCKGSGKKTSTSGGTSATTTATLQSLSIYSSSLDGKVVITVSPGVKVQLQAIGLFNDSTTKDLTTSVSWDTKTGKICTINDIASPGQMTAASDGTCTISATIGSVSISRDITVEP